MNAMNAVECLLDSNRGVYIPQNFAEECLGKGTTWTGVSEEDRQILLAGPDHEKYWDVWCDVLDTASIEVNGHKYTLQIGENGDLFAICPEKMTLEEQRNMGRVWSIDNYAVPDGHQLFKVGAQFICPLIYGDLTGLNDDEIPQYEWFVSKYGDEVVDSLADYDEFGWCYITNLRGPTALIVVKEKQS